MLTNQALLLQKHKMRRKKASKPVSEVSIEALAKAILDLHSCKAIWVESVQVKDVFEGETVWEGIVQVFDLQGHPKATQSYAWSHGLDNSKKRRLTKKIIAHPSKSIVI